VNQPISAPAGFVPEQAISYSNAGAAVLVDPDNPLPTQEPSFRAARAMTPGVDAAPGRAVAIVAGSGGDVALKLADDSTITVPVPAGLTLLPFAAKAVLAVGTTAVATYTSLR
jgi:hypothetical protein